MIKIKRYLFLLLFAVLCNFNKGHASNLCEKPLSNDHPLAHKHISTKETGNYEADLEAHKLNVRQMCSNKARWYPLISFLLKHGKTNEAIDVFGEFFERGLNIEPEDFAHYRHRDDIVKLMKSEVFMSSKPGKFLKAKEDLSRKRKNAALAKIEKMDDNQKPPKYYVTKGACPGECCTYEEWDVRADTVLYNKPNGEKIEIHARKGEKVLGLTGEVHLEPQPLVVVYEKPAKIDLGDLPAEFMKINNISDPYQFSVNKGEILFLLDYSGEGAYYFFYKGKIAEAYFRPQESCLTPSADCWLEYVIPASERKKKPVWWIKIRLNDGTEGWSDETNNFYMGECN